ncbi:hypothetical protein QAD02_008079 [Eretmocerus hayati]|uniref:Uncharacterized protein n=1 Tax=Eretmocerus hayati TaxID=131215 RepID=A0ACC2N7V6_9HYME|nr:hypothetical protein QAD02_008079 [Eretmocerus hayati]
MSGAKRLQYLFKDNAALPRDLQTQFRKVNPPGTSEDRQSTQKSIFNKPIVLADLTREHSLPNEELIRNISRTLNYGTDDMDLDEPSPSPNDHECPNDVCNGEPHQLQVDDIVQNFWEALAVSEEIAPAPPVSGDPNDVRYEGYYSDDEIDDQVEILYQSMKNAPSNPNHVENFARVVSIYQSMKNAPSNPNHVENFARVVSISNESGVTHVTSMNIEKVEEFDCMLGALIKREVAEPQTAFQQC